MAAVNALVPVPDYAVVTGDLVDAGDRPAYARCAAVLRELAVPYFAIMGNHDERSAFRAVLPAAVYGGAPAGRVCYAIDGFPLRLVTLDANEAPGRSSWPRGSLDPASLAWLAAILAAEPARPTLLAVHQPPFRTGLHYFDVFGYPGARRLRDIVRAAPQVGRVLCGHLHCVKTYALGTCLIASAPSTAPQTVPEFFEHRILGLRREVPGFVIHDWSAADGFSSSVYRRAGPGDFVASEPLALATVR